jgi:hypothetical protein
MKNAFLSFLIAALAASLRAIYPEFKLPVLQRPETTNPASPYRVAGLFRQERFHAFIILRF